MNMRTMERISDILCDELDDIANKGKIDMTDLEIAYKATGVIKNINKIRMADDYSRDDGNSYRSRHWVSGHYSNARREMMSRMQDMMDGSDMSNAERNSFARAMDALSR